MEHLYALFIEHIYHMLYGAYAMKQIVLREITWHVRDNRGIRPSQHGFTKGRFCLNNLISFYDLVSLKEGPTTMWAVLSTGEATPRILCPVLGPSLQERH